MGRDKAMIQFAGASMADWVARAVGTVLDGVVAFGRTGTVAGIGCVPDHGPPHRGPLAGLVRALQLAGGRGVLLVGVDQPLLRSETLRRLIEAAEPDAAVVPVDRGIRQVTCALYPGSWRAEAERRDAAGGSLRSLLRRLPVREVGPTEWRAWGEDGRSWFSVDSPEALHQALARYPLERQPP